MNTDIIKGQWNIFIGKVEQKLAHIAGDEEGFSNGKEHELLGRIQKSDRNRKHRSSKKCSCGCED
ncbi:MAG: CsbD family protein [Verrucomicrobiota bacterium]